MAKILRPKRGKKTSAEGQELLLEKGEIFFEVPEGGDGSGTGKIKMGDGNTKYADLPYFMGKDTEDIILGNTVVGKATTATKAGTATYATNSGTSTYSSNSAKASSATSATYATTATNAGTATYAKNAGTATKATQDASGNVITSTYAKNTQTFTEATTRNNIASGNTMPIILGKVKKFFADLKAHAFNDLANNLTTTSSGYALDARQGKALQDSIDTLNRNLSWKNLYSFVPAKGSYSIQSLEDGTEVLMVVLANVTVDGRTITHTVSKKIVKGYDLSTNENAMYFVEGGYLSGVINRFCGILVDIDYNVTCDSFAINGVEYLSQATLYVYYR